MEKRGQAALFVIIALVILILVIVVVLIGPQGLLIDIKSDAERASRAFEDCLENKLGYAVSNQNFVLQPDLLMAKAWLEKRTNEIAAGCSDFSGLKGITVIDDKTNIKSTVTFNAADFNSVTKVEVLVNYPMTVKRGEKEERISKFSVEVPL